MPAKGSTPLGFLLVVAVGGSLTSCGRGAQDSGPPPPKVTVSRPVVETIVEWDEYTGRLEAVESVEVRPRVNGYLRSVHFVDGAMVKKDDLLFVIDPRPYEAVLSRERAELELALARLDLARTDLARARLLLESRAISQEEADTRAATVKQAEASVAATRASVEAAALDVEFTRVTAPVSGRASRHLVDPGNLVIGGAATPTLLTTIVSLDPIHCYFEADERSYLKYARLARAGQRASSRDVQNPVRVALADEDDFRHEGYMDFVDNKIDENTGTMIGRAILPNPELIFSPGLFVRVRLPGTGPYTAILVPDEAVLSDQAQKYVYVVDDENQARYRRVEVGSLHEGLRIIRNGLGPDDRIIVKGTQRARPDAPVEPEEQPIMRAARGG